MSDEVRWRVTWSRRLLAAFFGFAFAIYLSGGHWLVAGTQPSSLEQQRLGLVMLMAAGTAAVAVTFRRNAAHLAGDSRVMGSSPTELFIERLERQARQASKAKQSVGVLLVLLSNELASPPAAWPDNIRRHLKRRLPPAYRFTAIEPTKLAFAIHTAEPATYLASIADNIGSILRQPDAGRGRISAEAGIAISTRAEMPARQLFTAASVALHRTRVLKTARYVIVDQIPGQASAA